MTDRHNRFNPKNRNDREEYVRGCHVTAQPRLLVLPMRDKTNPVSQDYYRLEVRTWCHTLVVVGAHRTGD